MYPPLLIHLIASILLLISSLTILLSKTNKKIKIFSMINRLLYLVFLATGFVLARYTFSNHWILTLIKIIIAFCLIICLEILAANKTQTHLSKKFLLLILLLFILVFVIGFVLHMQF